MYFKYFTKNLKVQFTYRFNVVFKLLATLCTFFAKVMVWQALFIGQNMISGVSLDETIFYAIASTIITALMSTKIGDTLGNQIYKGMISVDFIRPIRFKKFYVSQDLSYIAHETINAAVLAIILFLFYRQIEVSISIFNFGKFIITLGLAFILNYQLNWLFGLTSFWLQAAWHIRWITSALIKTFSGTVVPLWFYPGWMTSISKILPYRYIYFDPIAVLLGNGTQSFTAICITQSIWIIGISIIGRIVWKKAQQKVIAQGG